MIARAERLLRVSLTVRDLDAVAAFYCATFGFARVGGGAVDPALLSVLGEANARARFAMLRLGAEELELVTFEPSGLAYPAGSSAHDAWFQHVAIVVSDIDAAYARVVRAGVVPITRGRPVLLPPASGGATAFKFRDPEGHPLELLHFPPGTGDGVWQASDGRLFLGFDHSAIAVADAARSVPFYTAALGLTALSRSVNRGGEQERLDDIPGAVVDVVALGAASGPTPHVELLGYRTPDVAGVGTLVPARDVASARLVFGGKLAEADCAARLADGASVAGTLDPDGHRLLVVGV